VLVLLGDVLSGAYQQAQLDMGVFSPDTVSVGDLFVGALIPGLLLVAAYIAYMVGSRCSGPRPCRPSPPRSARPTTALLAAGGAVLLPPLGLIVAVLGSILYGIATPTEAASVGAVGALLLAASQRQLNLETMRERGASDHRRHQHGVPDLHRRGHLLAGVPRLRGRRDGDGLPHRLPGGTVGAVALVMLVMFLLGFILDFIEITFVVVPIVGPVLLAMGLDPVWLGVMIAINLQTSFLTPPFGFSLFYLRGVAPPEVTTPQIYRGVLPFIVLQLLMLGALALFPGSPPGCRSGSTASAPAAFVRLRPAAWQGHVVTLDLVHADRRAVKRGEPLAGEDLLLRPVGRDLAL
jgi:TRAP-type mannitol/chloroaromatic compound transport system permease large subunit